MLRRVYVLFFISLDRRQVFLAGVTANAVGPWVTQQARNLVATLEDQGRTIGFVRERDAKFVGPSEEVLRPVPYTTEHRFKGVGNIRRSEQLGGLVHEYCVAA
jgi:hypothetical protein